MSASIFIDCIERIKKKKKQSEELETLFGVTPDQLLALAPQLNLPALDTIIDNTRTGKSEKFIAHRDLGITNINEKECWKEYFRKHIGKSIDPKATILCGCAGYGSEVDALVELYGRSVIKQITFNDVISFFTTRIKTMYNNIKTITGDFMAIDKKTFTFVTINSPYFQGVHKKHREKALQLAEKKVLQIAPTVLISTSQNFAEQEQKLKDAKLQDLDDCHHYFEGQATSGRVHFYHFDKQAKTYNKKIFHKKISPQEEIVMHIKALADKIGSLRQVGGKIGIKDKNANGTIDTIVSVGKAKTIIEQHKRSTVKIIEDADQYFYVNQFFGDGADNPVYSTNAKKLGLIKNVFVIDHKKTYTKKEFKDIFLQKAMRFVRGYISGINYRTFGHSFTYLPLIDPKCKDVYKELGLNAKQKQIIESSVK